MRLKCASLMVVAALTVSSAALAAGTIRNSLSATVGGSAHVEPGGRITLITTRRPGAGRFGVTVRFDLNVRSTTVLAFSAYPCRSTSCAGMSSRRVRLGAGTRHVRFHGSVPVVKRKSSGRACVFAQVRDLGPKARLPGTVVRNGSLKGVSFCGSA